MKIFKIEVAAIGSYWELDVNAPYGWHGSGVYDVEHECWQEATFSVAAETLEQATAMISSSYEKCNRDWSNSADAIYYDPNTIEETEDNDGGGAEIVDYHFREPKNGTDTAVPARYSKEITI